jgi:uncharacterized protein YjbI with pentapeptide repeats
MAHRWIVVVPALALFLIVPATASAAGGLVHVDDATLKGGDGGATITATVTWNHAAAIDDDRLMSEGDLRAVAVSDRGHHPTVLATAVVDDLDDRAAGPQSVRMTFSGTGKLAAIRPGNRVVLTASQHMPVPAGQVSTTTYVTVAELQSYASPQNRIGSRDCSDRPIISGAVLNLCDLVGADLDRAQVSERYAAGTETGTRMLLADATGATMREASLIGTSFAGGRLNGADLTQADISNVSLANAEATGLIARGAHSDPKMGTAGANLFDARLTGADFRDAVLNGVSFGESRLDVADFRGSRWNAVEAVGTDFASADLRNVISQSPALDFADLTNARLRGATFLTTDLTWSLLCRTTMPDAAMDADADRDCRSRVDPGPKPVADPLVTVDGTLRRARNGAVTITGTVGWNAAGRSAGGVGLTAGDIRVVAVDALTGTTTSIATVALRSLPATSHFTRTIRDPAALVALRRGNRVVLTASQHPLRTDADPSPTTASYVTVDTLQAGPGRGRVGSRDCSDVPISPGGGGALGYVFCDLVGAVLAHAELAGTLMIDADLSGADLRYAQVMGVRLDGAALGSVTAGHSRFSNVFMVQAFARGLSLPDSTITDGQMRAATLDGADFTGSRIASTTFATTSLRRSRFTGATFDGVDLGYARLALSQLDHVIAYATPTSRLRPNSLFMADLTGATLEGHDWQVDEDGNIPWAWSTLCGTTMPPGTVENRDCPR